MAKTKPLTNTEVKSAKPKDKVYKLGDGNGLQLRVKLSGGKSWLLDYVKPFTSKRTSIGLGPYPAVTLADARTLRDDARRLIAKGIDPNTPNLKGLIVFLPHRILTQYKTNVTRVTA